MVIARTLKKGNMLTAELEISCTNVKNICATRLYARFRHQVPQDAIFVQ